MPVRDDRSIYPVMLELSACLCAEVNPTGQMCFCGILVGQDVPVEFDGCEECGSAYVRLDTGYPSTIQFPQPDQEPRCGASWAYTLAVGVVRCLPISEDGEPLPAPVIQEAARQQLADMAAIRRAITCCFTEKFEDANYIIGTYVPVPSAGGVAGGEITITISEDL